ncbi:endonuclease [Actinoplanes sp. NBRC 101535]|nr:endonuclease [Actinoplanes sp. NBRC 101535]
MTWNAIPAPGLRRPDNVAAMTITDAPAERRPARPRIVRTVLIWLLALPAAAWFVMRAFGLETSVLIMLVAFTPYVAAWSSIPFLLALVTRRWAAAALSGLVAFGLAVCVVPRAVPDRDTGPVDGVTLTVMSMNMLFGGASATELVKLIEDNDVDVLAVQEYNERSRAALKAAGLEALLPYNQLAPEWGASGSGIYSRHPMSEQASRRGAGGMQQAHATLQVPGIGPVYVESVHPLAPAHPSMLDGWAVDLRDQVAADPHGMPRILLGDFNATLDHKLVRDLIATGYRDAAATTGKGLIGTWGPYDSDPIPPVTIDHVLVDERIGVDGYEVHGVTKSDHRAIIAGLTLPAAS